MSGTVERLRQLARARALRLFGGRWRRGQTVVELAIFLPLVLVFGLVCIQFAVVLIAYINILNVTRDAIRLVSVHPHVIDATSTTTVKGRLPAGSTAANLTLTYSPACAALTSGKCAGRDPGARIYVTSHYVITAHLFLPTTLGWGSWIIAIPQSLPDYTINMQVEPN